MPTLRLPLWSRTRWTLSRIKPWAVYCSSALICLIVIGYWLGPKFIPSETLTEQLAKRDDVNGVIKEMHADLARELKQEAENQKLTAKPAQQFGTPISSIRTVTSPKTIIININPILGAEIRADVYSDLDLINGKLKEGQSYTSVVTYIRFDSLIICGGVWIVCTFALAVLVQMQKIIAVGSPQQPQATRSAEEFLTDDVSQSRARAIELYSRSTLMLVAGIVMAFIGVAVFYVSLPDYNGDRVAGVSISPSSSTTPDLAPTKPPEPKIEMLSYLAHGIRPFGILVFLEGISWFLLRQYRALIEDYKSFHRMYLRRANYLIALKTLSDKDAPQDRLVMLVASLLGEDLSGRLKQGESTESNEAVKNIEPNPVFALATSMLDIFKQQKSSG